MRRILFAVVAVFFLAVPGHAQVQVPPGPAQIITPPVPQPTPTPADPTVVTPDDLSDDLAIVAEVGGVEAGDEVVQLPVGNLLALSLRGGGYDKQPVAWTVSRTTQHLKNWPVDSDHLTFTAPPEEAGVAYLFTASINGETKPTVAMRWVVISGHGPQPPPVDPVTPVDPVKPPAPDKEFRVLFHEETGDRGKLKQSQIDIFSAKSIRDYMKSKGSDNLRFFDDDNDVTLEAKHWQALSAEAKQKKSPNIAISHNGKIEVFELPASVDATVTLLKGFGG